jgi:hypothetical protein
VREEKCSRCKHIQAKRMCGNPQSLHFTKIVDPSGRCEHFILNPGTDFYTEALVKMLCTNSSASGIADIERALDYGLPEDDEVGARFSLAEGYIEILANSTSEEDTRLTTRPEFGKVLSELKRATTLDRDKDFGYFMQPLNRARMAKLNLFYQYALGIIKRENGPVSAIAFAQEQIHTFGYLPSTPLIYLLEDAAQLYSEIGQTEGARSCLRAILNAAPVDYVDEQGREAQLRDRARSNLELLDMNRIASKGSPRSSSIPIVANLALTSAISAIFVGGIIFGPLALFLGFRARSKEAESEKGKKIALTAMILGSLATVLSLIRLAARLGTLR